MFSEAWEWFLMGIWIEWPVILFGEFCRLANQLNCIHASKILTQNPQKIAASCCNPSCHVTHKSSKKSKWNYFLISITIKISRRMYTKLFLVHELFIHVTHPARFFLKSKFKCQKHVQNIPISPYASLCELPLDFFYS